MLLAVQVGNTNLSLGVFSGPQLCATARIPSRTGDWQAAWDRCGLGSYAAEIRQIALGGVYPAAQSQWASWAERAFGLRPLQAGRDRPIPLRNHCSPPESVGTDRLLNAYAAYRSGAGEAVIVDFGTALSFSVVSAEGVFLGGAIAPGLRMSLRALHAQTAALPEVEPQTPLRFTGLNTGAALQAGTSFGLAGLVDRLLEGLLSERPGSARVLGTGGDLEFFRALCRHSIEPRPHLALEGLMHLARDEEAAPQPGAQA